MTDPQPPNANIAAHLPKLAADQPGALAVAVQGSPGADGRHVYECVTARELDNESNRLARGLEGIGIGPGVRTVLMVPPSLDFFSLTFALFKTGAIPIMVDPGMGVANLKSCLREAAPEAFIGISKAHAARVILGWARATNRINVTVGRRLFWGGSTLGRVRATALAYDAAPAGEDDMAAILFTSGSTGVPKGAVYTHGNFQAQVKSLKEDYGIGPGERDLATFPLFALFGPALGMAAIVPDMDASRPITADPRNLVAAMEDHETTNLFASPALIDVIGRHCSASAIKLPMLKRVISAGAPARMASLERFAALLSPGVEVIPSYGATEALPVASIGSRELLGETAIQTEKGAGLCVGKPAKDSIVRTIRIKEGPIAAWSQELETAEGEIGEICVQGPVVTERYYNRSDSTALAKIPDPGSGSFYHRMGDVGYFDGEGRLWYCGRKNHRVVMPDGTLFTIPVERVFDAHPLVTRTALVGVRGRARPGPSSNSPENPARTEPRPPTPVLCVELRPEAKGTERDTITRELLELGAQTEHTQGIAHVLYHPKFPVDVRHNAKIFREKLARWAQRRLR